MDHVRRLALPVFAGVALGSALWGANFVLGSFAVPSSNSVWPTWFGGVQTLIEAISCVAPGFLAGWLAKSSGLLVGAITAALLALTSCALVMIFWGVMPILSALQFLVFVTASGLITQSLAGVAGVTLSARRLAL